MKHLLKSLGLSKSADATPPALPEPQRPPAGANPGSAEPRGSSGAMTSPAGTPVLSGLPQPSDPHSQIQMPSQTPGAAVVTLDETNTILSADDACCLVFGWASGELTGQNLRVLLQEGADHLVAKFLQEQPPADRKTGSSVHLKARRKDGTEFPASVTALTWNSDTALLRKSQGGRTSWTAVFRPLQPVTTSPAMAAVAPVSSPAAASPPSASPSPARAHGLAPEASPETADDAASETARRELNLLRQALHHERDQRQALEQQLQGLSVDKTKVEQQLREQGQGATQLGKTADDLGKRLAESNQSAGRAASALQEQVAQSRVAEEELAGLRRDRDELQRKLAAEAAEAAVLRQRGVELEQRWQEASGELQAARADAQKKEEESGRLSSALHAQENDLQHQLSEAQSAVERAEASLREETERNRGFEERLRVFGDTLRAEQEERSKRFEDEMLQLRRQRDELQGNLTAEQQAAAKAKRRADELESRLAENAATLSFAQAERDKQDAERQQSEAELRVQLATAESLTRKLQEACAEAEERSRRLEAELGDLRRQQNDLTGKLSTEQRAAIESQQRVEHLESRLRDNTAELERIKGEQQQTGRNEVFEMELTSLRQVRDALCSKLASEQFAGNESKRRSTELEGQLSSNAAELERVKAQLDQLAGDQARATAELRTRLQAAADATSQLQAALQEQTGRCHDLETELANFEQERLDLSGKLAAEREAVSEFKKRSGEFEGRLAESSAELQRLKADRDQQAVEQAALEKQLQEQLQAARSAAEQAEAARREEAVRHREFEERLRLFAQNLNEEEAKHVQQAQAEIAGLQQQLAKAQEAASTADQARRQAASDLEKARATQKQQAQERSGADAELRAELTAARAAAKKLEASLKQATTQVSRGEQELANYRQERHELYEKFGLEQQAGAKFKRRIRQLEKELHDAAGSITLAKGQSEKAAAERGRVESALRADLAAAQAAVQKAESARQAQASQSERLKNEIETLRARHDELSAKQTAKSDSDRETSRQIEELEQRLRENAAELGRAQAALTHQAASPAAPQAGAAGSAQDLEELCRLRETAAAQTAELAEMDRRIRETVANLARVTASLEKERGERRRVEQRSASLTAQLQELHENLKQHLEAEGGTQERITHLEQQLLEREDTVSRVQDELQKEAAGRALAEEQLRTTAELQAHLRNCLASFEQAKTGFRRMQEDLNSRLQANQTALNESEARAQKEAAERQRAEEALAATRRTFQEQSQTAGLELTKLQSELQMHEFEKQRLHAESLQSRYASADSARVGSAMVNNLRRQIRQPVEDLLQSTRRLLEGGLEAQQKKLAESVLENALLLQSGLQEAGTSAGTQATSQPGRPPGLEIEKPSGTVQP